jgi:Protein of unknown function (DUF2934)
VTQRQPSHDRIEFRAYQIWEERGRPLGSPDEDWFRAEKELSDSGTETPISNLARELGTAIGSVMAFLHQG